MTTKLRQALMVGCILIGTLVCLDASATQIGQSRNFGAGVILVEPTGAAFKYFFAPRLALQFAVAFLYFEGTRMATTVDFIWYPVQLTANRYFHLLWYFGVGGAFGLRTPWYEHEGDWEADPAAWIRVPFGFSFLFSRFPMEAFIEFGPTNRVYPSWRIRPFVAGGVRFFF